MASSNHDMQKIVNLNTNSNIKVSDVHIFRNATTKHFNASTLNHQSMASVSRKSEKILNKRGVGTGVGQTIMLSTHSTQSLANEFAIHYLTNAMKNTPHRC